MKVSFVALLAPLLPACIKAPEIVVVDRATALEEQAAGSFDATERDLSSRAIGPRPAALTPEQLEAFGIKPALLVDHTDETEADRMDRLLQQHCVGEGKDGLLVDTHGECIGASDQALAIELIDRENRARMQLWRWMHTEHPETPLATLQQTWRELHVRGVVCRGWIQRADGGWEAKQC